jgi:hypothetical protein
MGPHRAEANLSALIESTEDIIWSVDLDYRLVTFNSALYRAFERGFSVRPTVGMRPEDLLPPERAALFPPLYERALSEGPFRAEYTLHDGRILEMALNPIVQDGETTGISVFGKDITERKKAEAALREAEEKYRTMFEGAPEGIYRATLEGATLVANPAMAGMLGYESAQEVVSTVTDSKHQVWLDPDERSQFLQVLEEQEAVRGYECQWKRKDGTAIWVSLSSRKARGKDGRALYYEGFIEDITERKRTEGALREAEQKYREIFDGALEGIYRISLEGAVLTANSALAKMLGYASAQEAVATITDAAQQVWLDPNERLRVLRLLEQHEVVRGYECQFKRKDGATVWVSLSCRTACGEDGRALYIEGFIEDITERKKAEARLQAQHERFQSIIENTEAGYFRIGMDGCFEDANPAWLRMHGFTRREDAIGLHFSAVQAPEDAGNAEAAVGALLRGESPRGGEFSRLRRDGKIGYHTFSANPVLDGDRVIGIEGFIVDTTERKEAERDRRHSERQYRSLFNFMNEGVGVYKLIWSNGAPDNYVLLDANRRFEEILGLKREDVVNRPATEVYGTETAPFLEEYASVVEGGRPLQFETYFPPMDKHFFISVTPIDEDLFATIFFDVTEQKKTQERYELVAENAADVIWMWDLQQDRCLYHSPSVRQLRGYSPEEIMDQPADQAMPADTYRMVMAEILSRIAAVEAGDESARIRTNEVEYLRKDGTTVPTETVTKLVSDARGKVRYLIGVSRDNTELKRAEDAKARIEDQLRQAQKLESVGRLAGGVAHDFNNLLTVINGYSRLLLGSVKEGDPLRDGLEEIRKAGERAAGLTQQLLAFSRKQMLQPRVLDLNRVVEEMRPMLARLMGEDVELCVKLQAEATTICADPHQLEQALMNLAVNSRDAMPDGGKFSIETGFVEWGESDVELRPGAHAGPYVMLAVSDTGVGMNEETRGHMFEPFFTTKGVGKGTGLGLSTIHGIVEQSGGYVEAESEPGLGTTFKIYMPRVMDAQAECGQPEAVPAMGGKETVLVVEDQAEVRKYAAAALRVYGYQVIQAANADEALVLCEREGERIDLILTDVVMPSMSGTALADRLRNRWSGIKVLFMSGYTDDTIVHHGVLENGAEFIQKPFSPDQLARKVREMLMAPMGPARIVVADDEAGVRSFLRTVLEDGGYEVIEAANGKEALEEARAGGVDLVITDLVMPEQEGLETIRALRKDAASIGIIAISGAFGGRFLEMARMLGAHAVLSKPFSSELLLAKVAEVLKSGR